MKIGGSTRTFIEQFGLQKPTGEDNRPAFQDLLSRSTERLQTHQLDKLIQSIDQLSKELSKQCSWRALMQYKERVRRFLEQIVKNGFAAQDRKGYDKRGRLRLYKVISQIDDLLAELAEEIIGEQKDQIKILAKIGDIRGLLLNLYS